MEILVLIFIVSALACPSFGVSSKPNILFIVADDMGWNDIGYNNPDIISPNIDSLAKEGITLQQSYVQPVCSPSRSALMTGYYPYRLGLQHLAILNYQPVCLPLDKLIFPQLFMTHGYATHIVGKWHLGFCNWECTPTYRGFDSFYGYYIGAEDYYTKSYEGIFDFRFNETLCTEAAGKYSTFQFTDRAVNIINHHDPDQPLFMYLPYQNVHFPLEAPEEYLNLYPNISKRERQIVSGSVTAMDESIGRVVTALKDQGLYDNTLIVFTSDNGGYTVGGGNNFPLRGGKLSIFEGGTRVPGFLHGSMLERSGVNHDGMMHIVDWFPTLAEAAGIPYNNPDQDGVSQWTSLNTGGPSPRNEFVYNLDFHVTPAQGRAGIRVGDYKLLEGIPGLYPGWYHPDAEYHGAQFQPDLYNHEDKLKDLLHSLFPNGSHKLYNLKDDPYEENNLYYQMPDVVKRLQDRLKEYAKKYVKANFPPEVPVEYLDSQVISPGWCVAS